MTLILSGTNGLSDVDGDASTPAVRGTDANSGIFFGADTVGVSTGGSEKVSVGASAVVVNDGGADVDFRVESDTVDHALFVEGSSGNVGIGTSTPSSFSSAADNLIIGTTSGNNGITIVGGTTGVSSIYLADGTTGNEAFRGYLEYGHTNDYMGFGTGGSERMRIDSSGNLLVGTTGISTGTFKGIQNGVNSGGAANYLSQNPAGTSTRQWVFGMNNSDEYVVYGYNNTSFNTGAYIAWGGTSWTAQSDERSKDIIEPIADAVNKVSTLRAVIGKYKTDEEGTRRSFLIAQDVQAVLPEAVDASKPDNLGLQYTEVIPLLVAAIKELKAITDTQAQTISALEARIAALETGV